MARATGREEGLKKGRSLHLNLGCSENHTVSASYSRTVDTWVHRESEGFVDNYRGLGSNPSSIHQLCTPGAMSSPP